MLRAVIYNRCSTEEESQKDALVKQVQESKNCVLEQGWQLVDTYVEAKSGTTSKGRSEYNRLYQDLDGDKFDIIVIKSQDRLMRNTKDWYLFLERMQKNRKRLYMYLERKFYTPDDALITGIKAILAEEYSRELSKKINNAHKNRQKEGKSYAFTNKMYGLKKLPDKTVVIDEKEAEMVRMVFQLSASGYGTHCSAEILYQNGYRNRNGNAISPSILQHMIRNPIYKGTVVQNRQHFDFESKQIIKNPKSEWIYHEHAVPAIVEDDLFERANAGLDARRLSANCGGIPENGYYGKGDLSGKIICGLCGQTFYRVTRSRKSGKVVEWKCNNYLRNGRKEERFRRNQIRRTQKPETEGCDNVHLDEERLYQSLEEIGQKKYQKLHLKKDELLKDTLEILRKAIGESRTQEKKEELEASLEKAIRQKNVLMEKLLEGVISDKDFMEKNQEVQERIEQMNNQLRALEADLLQNDKLEKRMESIRERLEGGIIEEAQAADMMNNIRMIKVFPDYLEISFDSWAILGLEEGEFKDGSVKSKTDKLTVIQIRQTCSTSHQFMIDVEKKQVLKMMRNKPKITAKEIAEKMGTNISLVHRRIRELKAEGKIRYSCPNGKGEWIILK